MAKKRTRQNIRAKLLKTVFGGIITASLSALIIAAVLNKMEYAESLFEITGFALFMCIPFFFTRLLTTSKYPATAFLINAAYFIPQLFWLTLFDVNNAGESTPFFAFLLAIHLYFAIIGLLTTIVFYLWDTNRISHCWKTSKNFLKRHIKG